MSDKTGKSHGRLSIAATARMVAAWLAALLLSIVPSIFLRYSVTSHPDIPQLFFLVVCMYYCCRFGQYCKLQLWRE